MEYEGYSCEEDICSGCHLRCLIKMPIKMPY
jgi:hypothetical protein